MKNQKLWGLEKFVGKSGMQKLIPSLCLLFGITITTAMLIILVTPAPEVHGIEKEPIPLSYTMKEYISEELVVQGESGVMLREQELLERCVEAEAGNQDALGKAYVCDVILNRLEFFDKYKTVEDVILDPHQFSCVSNGSIYKVTVSDETKQVVQEELQKKKDKEIIFFKTGWYHLGTKAKFKHQDHYFSS